MKNLQVNRLYLYPRFHILMNRVLSRNQPEVIELSQELPPLMQGIQNAILVALEQCLIELRRSQPNMDASLFTIDKGIFNTFDATVRMLIGTIYPLNILNFVLCWFEFKILNGIKLAIEQSN